MKIFQVTEDEWVAAETKAQAITFYNEFCDEDVEADEVRELSLDELRDLKLRTDDGTDDGGEVVSWKDELEIRIARSDVFPQLFASNDI